MNPTAAAWALVVDGCPPRLSLSEADIQPDLDRRRSGQSRIVIPRKESDTVHLLSGVFEGRTLGTPICLWVRDEDARPEAYAEMKAMAALVLVDHALRHQAQCG